MSSGVRMRFSYVQAHKWPEAPDVAQYRALLGCPTPTLWGPPVHFGARWVRGTAEKGDELASSEVEHGLLPGTRCASLPQAQDAPKAPAGPWGRPEMF